MIFRPTKNRQTAQQTYAFIDSQNLNRSVSQDVFLKGHKIFTGWDLDFAKFRKYLSDQYGVTKAFLFIGNVAGNEELYDNLRSAGFELVLKTTKSFESPEGEITVKGNVDTDLVLYAAAKEFNNYSKAIVVSGDGDFVSLYAFLVESNKLLKILIPSKYSYSQLLNEYSQYHDFVSPLRAQLQKNYRRRQQKPKQHNNNHQQKHQSPRDKAEASLLSAIEEHGE